MNGFVQASGVHAPGQLRQLPGEDGGFPLHGQEHVQSGGDQGILCERVHKRPERTVRPLIRLYETDGPDTKVPR